MKILRRLIYREASLAVAYVTVAFLALFFFFDMIDELRWVSREPGGYQLSHALLTVVLRLPNYLYELLPITVLIGTIYVMASLAQTSEFTIMRTSGMGPGRALRTLLVLGCAFVALTFTMGDYVAPMADRAGQMLKARYLGQLTTGATGGWLKERKDDGHSLAVNVRALGPDGQMIGIRIFDFDEQGRLSAQIQAASALVAEDGNGWVLTDAQQRRFVLHGADQAHVEQANAARMPWPTGITAEMVSAALLKPERMAQLGVKLFQGYWFAKPSIVKAQTVRPSQATIIQLINLVRKQASSAEIEELLKKDPTLSFNLLRFINSSGFGLSCEITSFRHAVMILGLKKLFRWAALLLTTSRKDGAPPAVGQTAVVRGRLMELLAAELLPPEECDNAFVVGVFSLIDTMLGMSLERALESVALPEPVLDALLHNQGVFAPFLELAKACESGDDEAFARNAEALHLSNHQINMAHMNALLWAENLSAVD